MTHDPTTVRLLLRSLALASTIAVAAFLMACAGGGGASEPLAVSCANIKALKSYRYTINVKLKVASELPAPTASPQTTTDAFTAKLNALLSDFTIDGAYIAPDHTTAILRFQKDEVELRAIGSKSWERVGTSWR